MEKSGGSCIFTITCIGYIPPTSSLRRCTSTRLVMFSSLVSHRPCYRLLPSINETGQVVTLEWAHRRKLDGFDGLMDVAAWRGR